ncbi:MAG: Restriction system protein [Hyphomicrobiales bacterium]|nr:Restriction system protein [Hyphomicrobiales bacterium]
MEAVRVWAIRAGSAGQADAIFLEHGQLALSSQEVGGDVSLLSPSRGAFKDAFIRGAPDARASSAPAQAGQLYRFVHEMRIGARVLYPRKIDRTVHWGEIVGPYLYEPENGPEFAHRRAVRWIARLSRDDFTQGALYELGATLSLFEVKSYAAEFRRRFESGLGPTEEDSEENAVRDVAESTNDFIARKLRTHFKGFPLEPFIADLFRAMGYRAHTTRKTRDDGIDVIAHRDELGIEPPILKIQVKAHEANVGADPVKAFYAMVHERDVGIFVTTGGYSASALEFARTRGNLKLVNGVELIGLIQKYYDGLCARHRQQIPLRRVLVPDASMPDAD